MFGLFRRGVGSTGRMRIAPLLLNMLFTAVLRVAVERFSVNADVVRDMVRTKMKDEEGRKARDAGVKDEISPRR